MKRSLQMTALSIGLVPTAAFAHPGHADEGSLVHSVEHMLGSFDPQLVVLLVAIGVALTIGVIRYAFGKAA